MAMMDKQIQNDLEAQAKSKTNAHNFVQLNVQNALNEAQQRLATSGAHLNDAQKQQVLANSQKIGNENSSIQAYTSAMAKLEDQLKAIPEGNTPDLIKKRQDIQGAMSQLYQKVGEKFMNSNDIIAGAKANNEILFGSTGSGDSSSKLSDSDAAEQAFQQHQTLLLKQAQSNPAAKEQYLINESKHVPGVIGQASRPVDGADRDKMLTSKVLDNKVKDVLDFAKKHRGSIDPKILSRGRQKAEELTSFYNKSVDGLGLTHGRLDWLGPQIKKNPTSIFEQILGNNEVLQEIQDSNIGRNNILLKSYGFPSQPGQDQSQQEKPKSQVIPGKTHDLKTINGKQYYIPKK